MKRITITLAALGIVGLAANLALADGALSYPMGAHVAAKYGIHHPGHNPQVLYQEAARFRHRDPGPYKHHRGYPRHGAVIVRPPVWAYPSVVVPAAPMYPRVYSPAYVPYRGFSYYGNGFSIGVGF
ncbi:MAG: hypothetical protein JXB62_18175 [Pirellulales bacterium]|nr:hypothetical protein [Pirellulales bacterium]